jgi:hypothetical protein
VAPKIGSAIIINSGDPGFPRHPDANIAEKATFTAKLTHKALRPTRRCDGWGRSRR